MTREEKLLMWTDGVLVEESAVQQLRNVAALPFVWPHVAGMPDMHWGMGATIGSVIPTLGVVIPAAVGVDIGCGMTAVLTDMVKADLDAQAAFERISAAIPHGRTNNGQAGDVGAWSVVPERVRAAWEKLVTEGVVNVGLTHPFAAAQLGTLGGGNHFIEVCLDSQSRVWALLHSGSRGPGAKIGSHFVKLAKEAMSRWHITLADPNLAYFPQGDALFGAYLAAAAWAQRYAKESRRLMMDSILEVLGAKRLQTIDCHHNYITQERHFGKDLFITRKGAVSARLGEWGIVPGCLAAGTRILMANATYKNIEHIVPGDHIISGTGQPTDVTNTFRRGKRQLWTYRTNNFHASTAVTPDHLHFIGDMSPASPRSSRGRVAILASPTRSGKSKFKWCALSSLPVYFTYLLPRTISFADWKPTFTVCHEGRSFVPSYALGYTFGAFLGNGTARYKHGDGGQISWSFDATTKQHTTAKLAGMAQYSLGPKSKIYPQKSVLLVVVHDAALARLFETFGKRTEKALPDQLWCSDPGYLQGLYDGLVDTDGHMNNETKKFTNTSTQLMEQFGLIHYQLFGYFPSVSLRKPSAGGLPKVKDSDCQVSYRATSLKVPSAVLSKDYQLIAPLKLNSSPVEGETFDLEVADTGHSFIANNVVVHNSMGDATYIVQGKGNRASMHSCSHGAGRAMSRTEAEKRFSVEDHAKATEGVVCLKDASVLEETPGAYKPVADVMAAQADLVEVVEEIKQVVSIKGPKEVPSRRGVV